jgi:hypothetical protein
MIHDLARKSKGRSNPQEAAEGNARLIVTRQQEG